MKIELLADAEADLLRGFRFYESQEPGVGDYFLDSLFADIDSLHLYAGVHERHWGFHRMLARRFPYAIYYRADDQTVFVYAVLDMRRSPRVTVDRLSEG